MSGQRLRLGRFPNFGIGASNTTQGAASPRQSAFGDAPPASPLARNATHPAEWWRGSTSRGSATQQEASCGPGNKTLAAAAAHPAGIVCLFYGVNDGTGYDGASRINMLTILDGLRADQLKIVLNENPTGVVAGAGSIAKKPAASAAFKGFSDWIGTLDHASGHANARRDVIVVDCWAEFLDSAASGAGAYLNKVGFLRDALHDTPFGAKRRAELIHARLAAVHGAAYTNLPGRVELPTGNPAGGVGPVAGTGNGARFVHTNPMLHAGGNGVVAGNIGAPPAASTVPEGWRLGGASASGSAGIAVGSVKGGTDSDGFPSWTVTVSGTLADQGSYTLQLFQLARVAGQLTEAAKLRGVGRVRVASGSVGLGAVSLRTFIQSGDGAARTQQAAALVGSAGGTNDRAGYTIAVAGRDAAGDHVLQTQLLDLADPYMAVANGGPGVMGTIQNAIIYVEAKFDNYTGAPIGVAGEITVSRVGLALVDN